MSESRDMTQSEQLDDPKVTQMLAQARAIVRAARLLRIAAEEAQRASQEEVNARQRLSELIAKLV